MIFRPPLLYVLCLLANSGTVEGGTRKGMTMMKTEPEYKYFPYCECECICDDLDSEDLN